MTTTAPTTKATATAWPAVPDATGPAAEQAVLDRVPTGLLVDGTWQQAADDATFPVVDPSTGETLLRIADATARRRTGGRPPRRGSVPRSSAGRSTCSRSAARSSRS